MKILLLLLIAVTVTSDGGSCTITKHFQKSSAAILCRLSEQTLASALQVNDVDSWNLLRVCMVTNNFLQELFNARNKVSGQFNLWHAKLSGE